VVLESFVFPGDVYIEGLEEALKALYDELCCECQGLGGSSASNQSLSYRLSTGTVNNANDSLGLNFRLLRPDGLAAEDWFETFKIEDDAPSNVAGSYITESGLDVIEQVTAADAFVDIDYGPIAGVSAITDRAVTVNFYLPSAKGAQVGDLYEIETGSEPFRQVRIYQPTGFPNRYVIEERNAFSSGSSVTSNPDETVFYQYDYQSSWTDPNTSITWDDYWLFSEGIDLNANGSFDPSTETVRREVSQVRLDGSEFIKERLVQSPLSGGAFLTESTEEFRYPDTDSDGVLDQDEANRETVRLLGSGSDAKEWKWGYFDQTDATDLRLRYEIDPYGGWRYLDYTTILGATNDSTHLNRDVRGFLDAQYDGIGLPPVTSLIEKEIFTSVSGESFAQWMKTEIDGQEFLHESVQEWEGVLEEEFNGEEYWGSGTFRITEEYVDGLDGPRYEQTEFRDFIYANGVRLGDALVYEEHPYGKNFYAYQRSYTSNGDFQSDLFKVTEIRASLNDNEGTVTTTLYNASGHSQFKEYSTLDNEILRSEYSADTDLDVFGRPETIVYGDGKTATMSYDCCGLSETVSREGVVTRYHEGYKQMQRPDLSLPGQFLDPASMLRKYRDTVQWIGLRRIATLPDGKTVITDYHLDGRLMRIHGTGAREVRYEYRMENREMKHVWFILPHSSGTPIPTGLLVTKEIYPDAQGGEAEWRETWIDGLGRIALIVTPDADGDSVDEITEFGYYEATDYLWRIVDPDDVVTCFEYDDLGRVTLVDGPEKREYAYEIVSDATDSFLETKVSIFPDPSDDDASETLRVTWTDFYDNKAYDYISGQETVIASDGVGGVITETVTLPDNTSIERIYRDGYLTAGRTRDANDQVLTEQQYFYSAIGRLEGAEDARNGLTSRQYDFTGGSGFDYTVTVTSPDPDQAGSGDSPLSTVYAYDTMDRLAWIEFSDHEKQFFDYWPTGDLRKLWGARTTPAEYTYDHRGRLKTLTTWQEFAINASDAASAIGISGSAVTTWEYGAGNGLLERKLYAQVGGDPQQAIEYDYTPAGRLDLVTNARGQDIKYRRDTFGRVDGIDIGNDTSFEVEYTMDASGRVHNVIDTQGGNHEIDYFETSGTIDGVPVAYATGQVALISYTSGPLSGLAVDYDFDSLGRYAGLDVMGMTSGAYAIDYGYDALTGRLNSVSHTGGHHIYEYADDSTPITGDCVSQPECRTGRCGNRHWVF